MLKIISSLVFMGFSAFAEMAPLVQNGSVVSYTNPLYRSIAQLRMGNVGCSASFLSETTLLSAGHCTSGRSARNMIVRVRDANGTWWEKKVARAVTHPGYKLRMAGADANVSFDFSIVKLASPFAFAVRPLKLVDPSAVKKTFRVTIAGYGQWATRASSSVLRRGTMLAQVVVSDLFGGAAGLAMIPDGSKSQATCPGDSGGPVLEDATLPTQILGVHSLSTGCQSDPDVQSYSQIPAGVHSWIKKYL